MSRPGSLSAWFRATLGETQPRGPMTSLAFFDDPSVLDGDSDLDLGEKTRSIFRLRSVEGVRTPAGFVVACEPSARVGVSPVSLPDEVLDTLRDAVAELGRRTGRLLGRGDSPLFVSIRSGSGDPAEGVPEAVLNIGLNDESVERLANATGQRSFALDAYRRLIQEYGHVVAKLDVHDFSSIVDQALADSGVERASDLPAETLTGIVSRFKAVIADSGAAFPQDPFQQLVDTVAGLQSMRIEALARVQRFRVRPHSTTVDSIIVQEMVFGNRDAQSGTGVIGSRDLVEGTLVPSGSFVFGGQGHDFGSINAASLDELADRLPEVHTELLTVTTQLERLYRDVVRLEFTVESGVLFCLQVSVAPRSGVAAVRLAVGLTGTDTLGLSRHEALGLVTSDHLDQILHNQFESGATAAIAVGLGASPGAAVGKVYFSADRAVDAYDDGDDVILVATETSPEDVHGMAIAEGILTAKGGLASHAAVVARGWGKPAVCGAKGMTVHSHSFDVDGIVVNEGDVISLDGASGLVFLGAVDMSESEVPAEFDTLLRWADEVRAGKLGVRANADSPRDAKAAREFGAEGIGLCRTEHQFLGARLPLIQRFILAADAIDEADALVALAEAQRADFVALLTEMDGLPVTVRLLDPPLHEFLPRLDELLVKQATEGLDADGERLLAAAAHWHEENPMLGVRGVRLGILRNGLYQMQVTALLEAVAELLAAGKSPRAEVMIPPIVNDRSLRLPLAGWRPKSSGPTSWRPTATTRRCLSAR
ncbi:MAG: putative PEP-binding protein [Acidimicrobiales bacterium]